jgi:hypothetical protein
MTNDSDRSDDDACPSPKPNEHKAKARIQDAPGDTPESVRAAEDLLTSTGKFFISGGALVRVVNRDDQGVLIEQVHEQTLKLILSDLADWEVRGRDGVPIRINPPHGVVQALLHGQDRRIPTLEGLARQPYFGVDGELISTPGYDPGSKIFAAFDAADYPMVEADKELAERSLAYLESLISEFEFETEADRSAALSANLPFCVAKRALRAARKR